MKFSGESLSRIAIVGGIILAAAVARLIPHIPNVTPIGAMALFAGVTLADRKNALLMVFGAMILSDLIIGFDVASPFVYLALAGIVLLGGLLNGKQLSAPVVGASLASSLLFFFVTNFGVWISQSLYPKTFAGLEMCFAAALPFLRFTVIGDLFYTAVFFSIFALIERATSSRVSSVA